jgi:hypothetical protein
VRQPGIQARSQLLANIQTQTGPLVLTAYEPASAVACPVNSAGVVVSDSNARIGYAQFQAAIAFTRICATTRLKQDVATMGKFDRIDQEVIEDLAQPGKFCDPGVRQAMVHDQVQADTFRHRRRPVRSHDLLHEPRTVGGLERNWLPGFHQSDSWAEVSQQSFQLPAGFLHGHEEALLFAAQHRRLEHFRHPQYAGQRRPQFVLQEAQPVLG